MLLQVGPVELNTFALITVKAPWIGTLCLSKEAPCVVEDAERAVCLLDRWWFWREA